MRQLSACGGGQVKPSRDRERPVRHPPISRANSSHGPLEGFQADPSAGIGATIEAGIGCVPRPLDVHECQGGAHRSSVASTGVDGPHGPIASNDSIDGPVTDTAAGARLAGAVVVEFQADFSPRRYGFGSIDPRQPSIGAMETRTEPCQEKAESSE